MLTKLDLTQIRKVVREEVETEVSDARKTLESQIRLSKMEVKNHISDLDDRLRNVEISVDALGKDMKDVKKRVRKIEKILYTVIKNYDEGNVILGKRVRKIEEHLQI